MVDIASPFHEGELAIQEKLGVREQVHGYAPKFVRSYLPDQHRSLLETLPFVVLGSTDSENQPTASILFGFPGFINSPDKTTVNFNAIPTFGDPLQNNLRIGSPLGLLAIEFETRRRNRLSGKVTSTGNQGFAIKVDQSFGNCPQYIQSRTVSYEQYDPYDQPERNVTREVGDAALKKRLSQADTFFIASSHFKDTDDRKHGVDVSHRGGNPGFMKVKDGVLTFPDFSGNNHYNTFGNILMNPKVGIIVPDFKNGDLLYIHGEANVIWDGPEVASFEGAARLVKVVITDTWLVEAAMPANWRFNDYSPSLEMTGKWTNATDGSAGDNAAGNWRKFRIDRVERESSVINSFYLTPTDGLPVETYIAGQHLPVRRPGERTSVRTYTISQAPNGNQYRLSIKREDRGEVSRFFHDTLRVGDIIEAMSPTGSFHLQANQTAESPERPQILVSAGVGITPMIAMLEELVYETSAKDRSPVVFVHSARNSDGHAFRDHPILRTPADYGVSVLYAYTAPLPQDIIDKRFHFRGRLEPTMLKTLLPDPDSDIYLCGPAAFMDAMRSHFIRLGVPDAQVQQETFGSSQKRETELPAPDIDVRVSLDTSDRDIIWNPSTCSLLDSVENAGVTPAFSCRTGNCGTCLTKILSGRVVHPDTAQFKTADDEALICCALPDSGAGDNQKLVLDL